MNGLCDNYLETYRKHGFLGKGGTGIAFFGA
jgi:hypothetical protein